MPHHLPKKFILASASPRRLDLLRQVDIEPHNICAADIDETPFKGESPKAYVERMARTKADVVHRDNPDALVLGADTIVTLGQRILGKPADAKDAERMLKMLSGRRHRVTTAIALARPCDQPNGRIDVRTVTTVVRFKRLSYDQLASYVQSGEWDGKAGAYAIQGRAQAFIPWIKGSYSNVVGLPLNETLNLLEG